MSTSLLRRLLRRLGWKGRRAPVPEESLPPDLSVADRDILRRTLPFTMTGVARLASLVEATRYLVRAGVAGDLAECGVWRGGSMMAAALTLLAEGDTSRRLFLYDTFAGMTEPTAADTSFDGVPAAAQLARTPEGEGVWCRCGLEEVKANLATTGYPAEQVHFVEGKVEETIPRTLPGPLALLRLDTDWYESTRHELAHLYPLLVRRGILIIDDYGHWQGARRATDEYFATLGEPIYLQRIDYTGRIAVKM